VNGVNGMGGTSSEKRWRKTVQGGVTEGIHYKENEIVEDIGIGKTPVC